jgi:hypothetical protein
MGNACSSDFVKINSIESDTFWSKETFKSGSVLGKGYDAAWPISLALFGINILDWLYRAHAARVRKDARVPLTPLIFKFAAHGNRIRQLCSGLYAFLWVCIFVITSNPSGGASSVQNEKESRIIAPDIAGSLGLFFRDIPWTAA